MLNYYRLLLSALVAALMMTANVSWGAGVAGVDCASSINVTTEVTNAGGWYDCDSSPDTMVIKFYEIGLCTSKPTYLDTSSCEFLYKDEVGKEAVFSNTTVNKLVEEAYFVEGDYKYAVLLISNTIGFKKTVTFDNTIYSMNGTSGLKCWTNGNERLDAPNAHSEAMFDCGSPNGASAQKSNITYKGLWSDAFNRNNAIGPGNYPYTDNMLNQVASSDAIFDIYLLNAGGGLATVSTALNNYGSPYPTGTADKIWGVQTFTNSKKIDSSTTIMDTAFAITDSLILGFGGYCLNGGKCLEKGTISKLEFRVTTD